MAKLASRRLILLGLALVTFGAIGFHELPGMIDDDAGGDPWINSLYCSVMTLTTIGYGDICPTDHVETSGRIFIVALSFAGLGMFCGPIMDFASSWKSEVPGGLFGVALATIGLGVGLFTFLEGMSELEAAYFTIVTGTTIGYGDLRPRTDTGRLATALFAILVVNVVGGLLQPAKSFLAHLCEEAAEDSTTTARGSLEKIEEKQSRGKGQVKKTSRKKKAKKEE